MGNPIICLESIRVRFAISIYSTVINGVLFAKAIQREGTNNYEVLDWPGISEVIKSTNGLPEVFDQVFDIFNSHTQPDQSVCNAGFLPFLFRNRGMGHRCRMIQQGLHSPK